MSSSMFIERNSINNISVDHQHDNSNLIVVYGKNGISFDERGLKNVIDEKRISSISVVRLTSPTPSMKEEEEELEKLIELNLGDGSVLEDKFINFAQLDGKTNNEFDDIFTHDDELDKLSNLENDLLDSDDDYLKKSVRLRNRIQNNIKPNNLRSKNFKRKPKDIVGIQVEEFYSAERANQIIDDALKMAGLSTQQNKDYSLQLMVIQNDHCYTPFTSPSQMKAKLESNRFEAEKQAFRKLGVFVPNIAKKCAIVDHELENSKHPAKIYAPARVGQNRMISLKFKKDQDKKKSVNDDNRKDNHDRSHADDGVENVSIKYSSMAKTLDCNRSQSDQDSNIVRLGSKSCKVTVENNRVDDLKAKRFCTVRLLQKPKNHCVTGQPKEITTKVGCSRNLISVFNNIQKANSELIKSKNMPHMKMKRTPTKLYLSCGPSTLSPESGIPNAIDLPNDTKINSLDNSVIIKKESTSKSCKTIYPTTITIKEIEVEVNPEEEQSLTTLKTSDKEESNDKIQSTAISVEKSVAKESMMPSPPRNPFPPDVVSSVQNNELQPSVCTQNAGHDELTQQIALHSNTNSYVLAAENDKQLDLINAIVEDELQNESKNIKQEISEINKDIPVLVRMLENTVNSLQNNSNADLDSFGVEANDISSTIKKICYNTENTAQSNAEEDKFCHGLDSDLQIIDENFLSTAEDDLPDDILQQVVELIKDEDQQSFQKLENANNEFILEDTLPINDVCISQSINQQGNQQMGGKLFNTNPTNANFIITTTAMTTSANDLQTQTTATIENVRLHDYSNHNSQIIRGNNGRIISLPPLGAPTTRAKRRLAELESNDKAIKQPSEGDVTESTDGPMQNNSTNSPTTPSTPSTNTKNTITITRRMNSKDGSNVANSKGGRKVLTKRPRRKLQMNRSHSNSESNLDENDNDDDDDDPNKLWCICRQPHNNRFMICCDVCGDWFHGTCVTVTKAMGLEMEQKGIDWTCPNCLKKQEEKKQLKISDMLFKKMPATEATIKAISSKTPTTHTTTTATATGTAAAAAAVTSVSPLPVHPNSKTVNYEIRTCKVKRSPAESTIPSHINNIHDNNTTNEDTVITISKTTENKATSTAAKQILSTGVTLTPKRTVNLLRQQSISKSCTNNKGKISKIIHLSLPCTTTTTAASTTITTSESASRCLVCKRVARVNSIYCSDECIRKHAQNALNALVAKSNHENHEIPALKNIHKNDDVNAKKKGKGLFEDLLSMADRKPKVERVNVIERKSGRILTGMNAPTTTNLKRWLQENPTFEVLPASKALYQQNLDSTFGKQNLTKRYASSPTMQNITIIPRKEASVVANANKNPINPQKSNIFKITSTAESEKKSSPATVTSQSSMFQMGQKAPSKFLQKIDKIDKTCDYIRNFKQKFSSTTQATPKITTTTTAKTTPVTSNTVASNATVNTSKQPIRLNVQRTLRDHLLQRIEVETADSKDVTTRKTKLTADEVEEFAKNTELEMFNYFCRDTGSKYRAKYRSLIFNIKDRKNKTLYAKICGKLITPKQLVHMTPEEMASQELAQWRENETKHQLEIIKKSELDLLNFNKSYQLKTHIIGDLIVDDSTTTPNPLEVIALNNNVTNTSSSNSPSLDDYRKGSTTKDCNNPWKTRIQDNDIQLEESKVSKDRATSAENPSDLQDNEKIEGIEKSSARAGLTEDSAGNRHQSSSISSSSGSNSKYRYKKSSHHKERRQKSVERVHHHFDSQSHKRNRSYSRSRSRSPEYTKCYKSLHSTHRTHHYHHHRHHHRHHRNSDSKYEKSKQKNIGLNNSLKYSNKKDEEANSEANCRSGRKEPPQHQIKMQGIQRKSPTKGLEAFNLIDQIIESTKTVEEAANLVIDNGRDNKRRNYANSTSSIKSTKSTHKRSSTVNENELGTASNNSSPSAFCHNDPYQYYGMVNTSDVEEYESNENLWTGNLNMIDVASFQITLQPILGNCSNLSKCLPMELDVVGRINPDTVWDYISKIKKSPNKEIVIIRLIPSSTSEITAYTTLYRYLENRHRLGVIKTTSTHIKDFYIHPLGAGKCMPCIIRTDEQLDAFHNSNRPDLLVGIIIRIVSKRSAFANTLLNDFNNSPNTTNSPRYFKKRRHSITHNVHEIDVDAIIKAPIISKHQRTDFNSLALPIVTISPSVNDANEPYSPGGSSDEDDLSLPIVKMPPSNDQIKSDDDELKRKMDEINRQIAAQELEIAGLLTGDTTSFATAANTSHVLANISIPSNLSQILASIRPSSSLATFNEKEVIASPSTTLFGAMSNPNPAPIGRFHTNYQSNINDFSAATNSTTTGSTSRLAQLSEEELLQLVPDDIIINKNVTRNQYGGEPPPPGV